MQSRLDELLDLASSQGVTGYQLSPEVYALRDKVSPLSISTWVGARLQVGYGENRVQLEVE